MSCGLESPAGFIICSNHRCSSVMETELTVHHRRINNWNLRMVGEGVGYEVSWSHYGSCHLCIWFYEVLTVEIKNFAKELLRKITLIIAKAIPWIPEPTFLSLLSFISVKSCWVLLYWGFVDPCCRWVSWAGLFWTVLHDGFSNWRWQCVALGQGTLIVCFVLCY